MQAYNTRTSHIQSRLLSTLDTLDAVQSSHVEELDSERRAREVLHDRLGRYIDIANVSETEKDDLRDAVIKLVEKGGFTPLVYGRGVKIVCS